jgi:hypothetical protein
MASVKKLLAGALICGVAALGCNPANTTPTKAKTTPPASPAGHNGSESPGKMDKDKMDKGEPPPAKGGEKPEGKEGKKGGG